jgi:hypothetical protein
MFAQLAASFRASERSVSACFRIMGTGLIDMIAWLLNASSGEIHVATETSHGPIVCRSSPHSWWLSL